jgi:thiosulfate/3-mercaptopyruvate sulfurtransferase
MHTTLISAEELRALQTAGTPCMVFDCTFDLMRPDSGVALYQSAHIPGSVHADLDTALSARHGAPGPHGVVVAQEDGLPASGGRHPLPSREKFATWLSSVGFRNDMQAVVYDRNGANFCGRLWWMLKWMGHDAVAVLDGGLQAWQAWFRTRWSRRTSSRISCRPTRSWHWSARPKSRAGSARPDRR